MKIAGRPIPRRVKRVALTTSELTGQLTRNARMRPDFLIVGAQRSGTTSMYKTLSQHPAVLKAVLRKGVHYFDVGYTNGPGWYRAQFPLQYTATRTQRALGVRPLTGESSPYYMFHPLAAERIARDLPAVRLIVLLRDPVERAYSAHTHEVARGYDPEKSFDARWSSRRSGRAVRPSASSPTRPTTATAFSISPTSPAAAMSSRSSGSTRGGPRPDPRRRQPGLLREARAGLPRGVGLPRTPRARVTGLRAAQRPAAFPDVGLAPHKT